MKKIDTLVEDINKLFTSEDPPIPEKEVDALIDTFAVSIKEHLKTFLYEQPRRNSNLRLSVIGRPDRQLWYDINQPNEKPLSSSLRIKFLYGYLLEELLILLSSASGHKVTHQQREVTVAGIKGHQDCMIDDFLIDCKSASWRSFQKFKNNTLSEDDPFGYIAQMSAYAEANGVDEGGFLVIDKQSGELCLSKVNSLEMINATKRITHLKKIVKDKTAPSKCFDDLPEGKSGNRKLDMRCVFCSHKSKCWSDANDGKGLRIFQYERGKKYLTQVKREPNVTEITS
jgi:hypothetical protein|tara:strand:+ start:5345 stop:6199 length:855 start_codon:yes stop_codon:yes gene_type:complete